MEASTTQLTGFLLRRNTVSVWLDIMVYQEESES